jgi:hypothetical protein
MVVSNPGFTKPVLVYLFVWLGSLAWHAEATYYQLARLARN